MIEPDLILPEQGPLPPNRIGLYVTCIVVLCSLCAGSVIAITFLRPTQENTSLFASIFGIITPVIAGLMAGVLQQNHLAVNSRLSQMLALNGRMYRAIGVKEANEAHEALKAVEMQDLAKLVVAPGTTTTTTIEVKHDLPKEIPKDHPTK